MHDSSNGESNGGASKALDVTATSNLAIDASTTALSNVHSDDVDSETLSIVKVDNMTPKNQGENENSKVSLSDLEKGSISMQNSLLNEPMGSVLDLSVNHPFHINNTNGTAQHQQDNNSNMQLHGAATSSSLLPSSMSLSFNSSNPAAQSSEQQQHQQQNSLAFEAFATTSMDNASTTQILSTMNNNKEGGGLDALGLTVPDASSTTASSSKY
jgi:hypothetical protein